MNEASIQFLMLYDQKLASFGDLSSATAKRYCEGQGYQFTCHRQRLDTRLSPQWNKIVVLRRHLSDAEWLVWCDADAIITDPRFSLAQLIALGKGKNLMISQDLHGSCSGFLLIRNTPWSASYLETLLFLGEYSCTSGSGSRPKFEQDTMNELERSFPTIRSQIARIPESIVANPATSHSKEPPFIMHYWSSINSTEGITACMRSFLMDGWSESCRP